MDEELAALVTTLSVAVLGLFAASGHETGRGGGSEHVFTKQDFLQAALNPQTRTIEPATPPRYQRRHQPDSVQPHNRSPTTVTSTGYSPEPVSRSTPQSTQQSRKRSILRSLAPSRWMRGRSTASRWKGPPKYKREVEKYYGLKRGDLSHVPPRNIDSAIDDGVVQQIDWKRGKLWEGRERVYGPWPDWAPPATPHRPHPDFNSIRDYEAEREEELDDLRRKMFR